MCGTKNFAILFTYLRFDVPPEVDYIHANYVKTKLCKLDNKFICTQVSVQFSSFYSQQLSSLIHNKSYLFAEGKWPLFSLFHFRAFYLQLLLKDLPNSSPSSSLAGLLTAENHILQHIISNRFLLRIDCYNKSKTVATRNGVVQLWLFKGPMDTTINDFWRMTWQEKPRSIIMLCKLTEGGKPKCAQYFPGKTNETKQFGKVVVQNVRTTSPASETVHLQLYFSFLKCSNLLPKS